MNNISKQLLSLILILLPMQVQAACGWTDPAACAKDWVVSPETHPLCGGYFYELPRPFPEQMMTVLPNQPVTITADRGQFIQTGPTTLTGNIHLIQGNRQIFADEAKVYRAASSGKVERIIASGNVDIVEPGLRVFGQDAIIDESSDQKTLHCAQYRLYARRAHGEANCIQVFGKERLTLDEATYSTCSPQDLTWVLKARRMILNRVSGRGQSWHTRLYFKGTPIAYLPYFDFPIDDRRQTGFLYPRIDYTSNSGFELATPFYWNLAPNYDATFTPRILTKRGIDFMGRTRYLTSNASGYVQGSILPGDRAYHKFRKRHLAYHPGILDNDPRVRVLLRGSSTRRSLFTHHDHRIGNHLAAALDFQGVSDDNFFMDLGNSLQAANTTQLLRQGQLTYMDWHNNAFIRVQEFQTLHPFEGPITFNQYRRAPEFYFRNVYPHLESGFHWAISGDFTHFTHKRDPFTYQRFTTGDRTFLRPSLSYPVITPCSFVKPRLQFHMLSYSLSRSPKDIACHKPKHPALAVPMFDLDTGLMLERELQIGAQSIIQTLEPRAYYLWVPCRQQNDLPNFDTTLSGFDFNQLFRDNRFSGLDRIGDANQVTLAITTRFLGGISGEERLSATLGQIIYFKDRRVTLCDNNINSFCCQCCKRKRRCDKPPKCIKQELPDYNRRWSNYVGVLRYHLIEPWTLNSTGQWNPNHQRVDEAALWLQYRPDEFNVLNLGYLYLRHNPVQVDPITGLPRQLHQAEGSFAYLFNENWRLLSRVHYDLKLHRVNEIVAGFEYQGCCTALRFSIQRYLQPNNYRDDIRRYRNGFYFQFIFKGLGSVGGSRIDTFLSRSIPGYRWQPS